MQQQQKYRTGVNLMKEFSCMTPKNKRPRIIPEGGTLLDLPIYNRIWFLRSLSLKGFQLSLIIGLARTLVKCIWKVLVVLLFYNIYVLGWHLGVVYMQQASPLSFSGVAMTITHFSF